jgi:hypothetical protein
VGGKEVGHVAGLACGAYVVGRVGWDLVVESGILLEQLNQLAHQYLGLGAGGELFGDVLDLHAEVRLLLRDLTEAHAAQSFDFYLEGGVGLAADLPHFDKRAYGVEVVGERLVALARALGDHYQAAVTVYSAVERLDRAGAPDGEVDYCAGKNDYVLEG